VPECECANQGRAQLRLHRLFSERSKRRDCAGQVHVLADPHLELTKALGVVMEAQDKLGTDRCKRFSAVIVDNTFKARPVPHTPAPCCPARASRSMTAPPEPGRAI